MRFHADGPNIPLDLIEARDSGDVVFLCGAGVSMPAGLPSFRTLAQDVVQNLGVPANDRTQALLTRALAEQDPLFAPPMDQVFGVLQRDYGAAEVEAAVARRLRHKRSAPLDQHRIVLRLSAAPDGRRRLVTTNFDRLFEAADSSLPLFAPPNLPDLTHGSPLTGLTYLHGRLAPRPRSSERQGLILSAPDFGRAYLAEGWATQFVRQLLDRFAVVLLGYSADDPPVRYLLEGLHASRRHDRRLFAFAAGDEEAASARWSSRGVRPIPYAVMDGSHSALWRSLAAWADRSDDVPSWRAQIIEMAGAGPASLESYQRGQVAALVSTSDGAEAFANADPPPPAEWLCSFDNQVRFGRPGRNWFNEESSTFDPHEAYGLDDDPPNEERAWDTAAPGVNLLRPLPDEGDAAAFVGWAPGPVFARAALSPRLFRLGWWFGKICFEPAAMWWASGQLGLQPAVLDTIERRIAGAGDDGSIEQRRRWRLLLESWEQLRPPHSLDWYGLLDRIKSDGWSNGVQRAFSRIVLPRLVAKRPRLGQPKPPEAADRLRDLIDFEVSFLDAPTGDFEPPGEVLPFVVGALRDAMLRGSSLLADIGTIGWRTPTLHPESGPGDVMYLKADAFFLLFSRFFDRLADLDAEAARKELIGWPHGDEFFFDKLRVWAWRRSDLATSADVIAGLTTLSPEIAWGFTSGREWLVTVRARWPEFEADQRRTIERIVLAGPPVWTGEPSSEWSARCARACVTRLGWLHLNGCSLSEETQRRLEELRTSVPDWNPEWDAHAADSHEGRSGTVQTDYDPRDLPSVPLRQVAQRALELTQERPFAFVRSQPFEGLVKANPARAIFALSFEARHGRYPIQFWNDLLGDREVVLRPRARALLAGRIAALPASTLAELRFAATRWIGAHLVPLLSEEPELGWRLWDAVFTGLTVAGTEATTSGIGDVSIGGVRQQRSRRTFDHAINGPIGELVRALFQVLGMKSYVRGEGLPQEVRSRLENSFKVPGEGKDHAVAIAAHDLSFLFHADPSFASDILVPLFDPAGPHGEAAWSGYLSGHKLLAPADFRQLKRSFLEAFSAATEWRWSEHSSRRFSEFLVAMALSQRSPFLTLGEVRRALQAGGAPACDGALDALARRMSEDQGWQKVKRFLVEAWPREIKLRSATTTERMASLAVEAGDNFPDAVDVVLPYLLPLQEHSFLIFRMGRHDGPDGLASRFPAQALRLLDALIDPNSSRAPYDLGARLDEIATAAPSLRQSSTWRRLKALAAG